MVRVINSRLVASAAEARAAATFARTGAGSIVQVRMLYVGRQHDDNGLQDQSLTHEPCAARSRQGGSNRVFF